jgi:hypothetical protein
MSGLCGCGCGRLTKIAKKTRTIFGWVKGQPYRYLQGHSPLRIPKTDPVQRFESWFTPAAADECWPWQGSRSKRGYGKFWADGRTIRAPRWALERKLGRSLQPDEVTRHTCDNPPCVNPAHLIVGSTQDNASDAVERGLYAAGARNGRAAKLNYETVAQIRRAYADGVTQQALADAYGVCHQSISNVVNHLTWQVNT